MRFTSLLAVASLAIPASHAGAQETCHDGIPDWSFDPKFTTTVEQGAGLGYFDYVSPEHSDTSLVYHVGDATTGDGCVAGIEPGSSGPTGVLLIAYIQLYCLRFNVESEIPAFIEVFDYEGELIESFTTSESHVELFSRKDAWMASVRITPGSQGGNRAPLCIDEIGGLPPGVPARQPTWGALKAAYR